MAKQQAVGDLKAVRDAIAAVTTAEMKANATKATSEIDALLSDPAAASTAAREGFYSAGVALKVANDPTRRSIRESRLARNLNIT
jgi:hypothetical protein